MRPLHSVQLIGAACGLGAPDIRCEEGPGRIRMRLTARGKLHGNLSWRDTVRATPGSSRRFQFSELLLFDRQLAHVVHEAVAEAARFIVIGGDLPASHRERFRLLMNLRPRLAPLQVQSFTLAEWDAMMKKKHLSVLEALTDGKALYGQQLFNRWRRQLRSWQTQGLHRTRFAWVIPPVQRKTDA